MAKRNRESSSGQTWKNIKQEGKLRSTTQAARRRRLWRLAKLFQWGLLILILGGGLVYALWFSGKHIDEVAPLPERRGISRVDFGSDGVLKEDWFRERFVIEGVLAEDFDVFELKAEIEGYGQVAKAAVSIELPDTLHVRVAERNPLLRARVRDEDGTIKVLLIAGDGTVFEGRGYPVQMLNRLPGLVGTQMRLVEGRYERVAGMEFIRGLLELGVSLYPALYNDWKWISFEHFVGKENAINSLITVKSGFMETIVFAPEDFEAQLFKLNEVIAVARRQSLPRLKKVDLSFAGQAIVEE